MAVSAHTNPLKKKLDKNKHFSCIAQEFLCNDWVWMGRYGPSMVNLGKSKTD
jgi:hypothetical protein